MDIAATAIIPISLDHLIVSAHNARTIDREPIDDLAASIAAEGLLQNLTVIEGDAGVYEVIAGKRRFGALQLLRDRGQLPPGLDTPPCRIVDDERAISASLAENIVRQAMHPADEFVAFQRLADAGRSIEEIAQEFGVLPVIVQRRLRLAKVAPTLFELFRQDEIRLDQMMALAITEDHAAQVAAWNVPNQWEREASRIRDRLTKSEFNIAKDKAAKFVGAQALAEAGVIVRGDLFSDTGDGYTDDRLLVDQLALAKLERDADAVRDQGWSWVEARIDHSHYDRASGRTLFSQIYPESGASKLSSAEKERLASLTDELERIQENEDPDDEAASERAEAIEAEISALEERGECWTPKQLAAAGAVVTIAQDGTLEIVRGLVRAGDKKPGKSTSTSAAGKSTAAAKPDLSGPMILRLGAQRTAILQAAVMQRRDIALAVLAHTLLLGLFYPDARWAPRPTRLRFDAPDDLEKNASELPMMRYHAETRETLAGLRKQLPTATQLFAWLLAQPTDIVLSLITAAVAQSITANINEGDKAHAAIVGELIAATGTDFADHWEATRETFLAHVPRNVIEQAVTEARGEADAAKLQGMKKEQLIDAAEQLLAGKRWLPKPLRTPKAKATEPPRAPAPGQTSAAKARSKPAKKKPAAAAKSKPKATQAKPAAKKGVAKKAGKRK